jgi:hypothetical protein
LRSAAIATTARTIGFAGAVLCSAAALAAGPKPDASVKNRAAKASVFLDSRIKADAALAADCLAEGKKWIAAKSLEAGAEFNEDSQLFHDGAWTFERRYTIRSVTDRHYVSIVRSDYMNTGGAHPNSDVDAILWDATKNKRISIRPFFIDTADDGPTMKAVLRAVIGSLNGKFKRDPGDIANAEAYKDLEPKLLKIGGVTLAPSTVSGKSSGLTFHYPPYAVAPYAEGEVVAFVPWDFLKPYLAPEGIRIFAGMRPEADKTDRR